MKLEAPVSNNYAAVVVRVNHIVELGLDNLVGVPVLGCQALTQRDGVQVGDLKLAFTAETQLSHEYAHHNDLFRDSTLNVNPDAKGYLESNRRIRALKLAGQRSSALLMPLDSLHAFGYIPGDLKEGDTFDTIYGVTICKKYEVPVKQTQNRAKTKIEKAFKRVDKKLFPEHLETSQYHREKHLLRPNQDVVVTQKLHGTSIRVGRVPCLRQKGWFERKLNRWFPTTDYTYDTVFGSRKVIKDVNNPNQDHYYESDIWTEYGKTIADLIPEGYIVYAELVGFTPDGAPIQKGYTYEAAPKQADLYVYRVATINAQGTLADLSWDGVKQFCTERGLKWTPEITRILPGGALEDWLATVEDAVFYGNSAVDTDEEPIRLSDKKTVDEGVCLRQEGVVPTILKVKSARFLEHETKILDAGDADIESAA